MNTVEITLQRMAAVVRQYQAREVAMSLGENPDKPMGWWVLAVGEGLDRDSFEHREDIRNALLEQVTSSGIRLREYVWVWDDTDTAQLVVATLPDEKRAEKLAERLRTNGLVIRILREKI